MIYVVRSITRLERIHFGRPVRLTSNFSWIGDLWFPQRSRTDKVNRSMSSGVKLEAIVQYPRSDLLSRTRAFYSSAAMKSLRVEIRFPSFRHLYPRFFFAYPLDGARQISVSYTGRPSERTRLWLGGSNRKVTSRIKEYPGKYTLYSISR